MARQRAAGTEVEQDVAWQLARWSRRNRLWRSYRVGRLLFRTLWVMYRERNRVMRARARGDYEVRPDLDAIQRVIREFRVTASTMGGLLIKLGQFLSARADLLPPEALAELAKLQDEVPPEPFADIQKVIERELHAPLAEIFASVDQVPAGSASLGQVHRARLYNGQIVAVKVQRPDIQRIVRTDLSTLGFVLDVVRRVAPAAAQMMDLRGLFREFSKVVYAELDYVREGHSAERFARLFADEPDVGVPGVLWDYSTRRVLTLEWASGIKITQVEKLDAAGIDREALARRLIGTYMKQVLDIGVFHADPHPGNIFVEQASAGMRLIFVDFGMMGSITPQMRRNVRDCFLGMVQQNAALVVHALDALGFVGEHANLPALEQAIGMMLAQFSTLSLGHFRDIDVSEMLDEVETLLYHQPLRLPSEFAFLGRAASMLVGLTMMLAPDINFLEVARPYASHFVFGSGIDSALRLLGVDSVNQLGKDLVREGIAMARSISLLPLSLERVLDRAERGDLRLIIESPHLDPTLRSRVGRRIAVNLLNRPVPAWVPLSMITALAVTIAVRRHEPRES